MRTLAVPSRLAARLQRGRSFLAFLAWSVVAGVALGAGSSVAYLAAGCVLVLCAMLVPVGALALAVAGSALTFRFFAPQSTGPLSLVPDVLVALFLLRVGFDAALEHRRPLPKGLRRAALVIAAFVAVAVLSTLVNHDAPLALGASLRQYLRFPLFALGVGLADLRPQDARRLVTVVLAVSLVQLPLAVGQYLHPVRATILPGVRFYQGDNVSGTFGLGGSNTAMVFLLLAGLVWLQLAIDRLVPAWTLWLVAPAIVLPMAMGSAASFVLFLPAAVLGLVVVALVSGRLRLPPGAIASIALLFALALWAAGHLALAPGLTSKGQESARALLSAAYLTKYIEQTGSVAEPDSRLGFLRFAVAVDAADGARGILLGQGPGASVLTKSAPPPTSALARYRSLQIRDVESFQRSLLGFGVLGATALVLLVLVSVVGLRAGAASAPPFTRALATVLPVAGALMLVVSIYNGPWTDPGVGATFWTLVAVTHVGLRAAAEP